MQDGNIAWDLMELDLERTEGGLSVQKGKAGTKEGAMPRPCSLLPLEGRVRNRIQVSCICLDET